MKCVKLIKEVKNLELGEVIRITDSEAELRVKSGKWGYTSKSEWKLSVGKNKSGDQESNQVTTKKGKKKNER